MGQLEEEEDQEFSLPEGHILYRFETTSGAVRPWVVSHHIHVLNEYSWLANS